MDGNGHSPMWGPATKPANPQGILLENLLASEDLVCLNSPESPPTYIGDDDKCSWIDVSAASVELADRIWKRQVVEYAGLGSDHALITRELALQAKFTVSRKMYNWHQVEWTRFRNRLREKMRQFSEPILETPLHIDEVVTRFTTMMQ